MSDHALMSVDEEAAVPVPAEAIPAQHGSGAPVRVASDGEPRLGVVLVNFRGAADTIECLESLLRSDLPIRVAVVDNGSGDGSLDSIRAWASGEEPFTPPDNALGRLTDPPLPKPIPLGMLSAEEAVIRRPGDDRLVLIHSPDNLGFAGGNNIGIRHLLLDPAIGGVWLLNNDTVVEPTAAAAVLATLLSAKRMGMVGTVLRFYHRPDTVQALNGMSFSLLTGNSRGLHGNKPVSARVDPRAIARQTKFVLGASLAVTRQFVETVGLMSEAYFLYYEEIDWSVRNDRRFDIGFARGATVFHKHGGSIGSSAVKGGRSANSEYWLMRARLLFFRQHYPWLLPLIWPQGWLLAGRRLIRRQPDKAGAMMRALMGRAPT